MQRLPFLYVAKSRSRGRGVFTARAIRKGDLIEICPVIVLPESELPAIDQTGLYDYYFLWGKKQKRAAIALGYGSLYNHAYRPNARYILDLDHKTIDFICVKNIGAGEEITVNYNGREEDETRVWFDKRGELESTVL